MTNPLDERIDKKRPVSILSALFYQFASAEPHRPFLVLLGFGVACGVSLLVYERLLRLFSQKSLGIPDKRPVVCPSLCRSAPEILTNVAGGDWS
jgi:hypothetical protein